MALSDKNGNLITLDSSEHAIESKLETRIADSFNRINQKINNELLEDPQRRVAEKFRLCRHLIAFEETGSGGVEE